MADSNQLRSAARNLEDEALANLRKAIYLAKQATQKRIQAEVTDGMHEGPARYRAETSRPEVLDTLLKTAFGRRL
jgi:hypothetical protein